MASGDASYIAAVTAQLLQTQGIIQTVLAELRENSSGQTALNAELRHLRINVNTLNNIIRGDDGNPKPLVMEVEVLKIADLHLDKRVTACVADIDDQIISLGKNMSEMVTKFHADMTSGRAALETLRKDLETKLELSDKLRREYETARLQAQVQENNDIRLDGRSRFGTWATMFIALLSLAGTITAILLK